MYIDAGEFVENEAPEPIRCVEKQEGTEKAWLGGPAPGPSPLERKKRLEQLRIWVEQMRREIEVLESLHEHLVGERQMLLAEMGELEPYEER